MRGAGSDALSSGESLESDINIISAARGDDRRFTRPCVNVKKPEATEARRCSKLLRGNRPEKPRLISERHCALSPWRTLDSLSRRADRCHKMPPTFTSQTKL